MMTHRRLLLMAAAVFTVFGGRAQTISAGDTFWDGEVLFTAERKAHEGFTLTGVDADGNRHELLLQEDRLTRGSEYRLAAPLSSPEGDTNVSPAGSNVSPSGDDRGAVGPRAPYGCVWGAKVQVVRQRDLTLLTFYVKDVTLCQVLTLTPETQSTLTAYQKYAEAEPDKVKLLSKWVANQKFLRDVHPDVLVHWLSELEKKQSKTLIERINEQLISYALDSGNYGRQTKEDGHGAE